MHPIIELISAGEGEDLDFKQTISSASKIAKTMAAFANHKGGRLLVGVRDNGSIAGVRSEDEAYMLDLAASFFCKPEIELEIKTWELNNKTVLEVVIPRGNDKPYAAKDEEGKYWVYIRVQDKSLLASKIVVDVLKGESRESGAVIQFGPKEQGLLDYLGQHERITLKDFCKKMNISRRRGTRIIVNLIRAGVIRSHTTEKTEFYTLS